MLKGCCEWNIQKISVWYFVINGFQTTSSKYFDSVQINCTSYFQSPLSPVSKIISFKANYHVYTSVTVRIATRTSFCKIDLSGWERSTYKSICSTIANFLVIFETSEKFWNLILSLKIMVIKSTLWKFQKLPRLRTWSSFEIDKLLATNFAQFIFTYSSFFLYQVIKSKEKSFGLMNKILACSERTL